MGFFANLLSMGGAAAGILALDATALLLGGGRNQKQQPLKNKSFRSDAYGTPFMRCRGTVRCQGKVLWATPIRTSIWKTTSGGLFGMGSHSVYYNKYSQSSFIGFGKKLGGGAAVAIQRLWADGKLIYNAVASQGSLTGTVTVDGAQTEGAQSIVLTLASGASLTLDPGDLISVATDGTSYQVQLPVSATGPGFVRVVVWPPLAQSFVGGETVFLQNINQSPWDLSWFDPNPHDGSHPDGGYPCPPGGIRFYLGADDQQPDPYIVQMLGTGNVPGYRGIVGCMIHDLQLANSGDHPPNITAEIAYDVFTGAGPTVGPIAGVTLAPSGADYNQFAVPYSGVTADNLFNPLLSSIPYVFVATNATSPHTVYRINTQTNLFEASIQISSGFNFFVVDRDGFFYVSGAGEPLQKYDGVSMSPVATSSPYGFGDPAASTLWDATQSLFGNPVPVKLIAAMQVFGGTSIFDRNSCLPFGTGDASATRNVVIGYDKNGVPIIQPGDTTSLLGSIGGSGASMCVDADGNLWALEGHNLIKWDCQFVSSVYFDSNNQPHEFLAPPSFASTTYDVSSVTVGSGTILYYSGDNSIVISGDNLGKFDIATASVVSVGASGLGLTISPYIDLMGTFIVGGPNVFHRIDASSLQVLNTYTITSLFPGFSVSGTYIYDPITDSFWYRTGSPSLTQVYRFYLDRGNGGRVGLDSIVSSLMTEDGFDPSTFDVTQLTTQGKTCRGVEFGRESYQDSLRQMMENYLFDACPIDGKEVFIPRGNTSAATITEDDLGALGDPAQYEPRVVETIQDALDTPLIVSIHYNDPLKNSQPATQYAKRISKPYASSLGSGVELTTSNQQLDITSPITENATPIKQQAEIILWDKWTGRIERKFKLGPKWSRLSVGDVLTLTYKGTNYLMRVEEFNYGASGAIEITARSVDNSVYSTVNLAGSSSGLGSGTTTPPPKILNNNYTLNPAVPLSSPNSTTVRMSGDSIGALGVTATFTSGLRTFYNNDNLTVTDPGAGNTQIYYVTVYDPTFIGEVQGSVTLTRFCETTAAAAHVGELGYINMGSIVVAGAGASGGSGGPGGQPSAGGSQFLGTVSFGPTTRGPFTLAHSFGVAPAAVVVIVTGPTTLPDPTAPAPPEGDVDLQVQAPDAQNIYLFASADGLVGYVEVWG